jgi:hypothetical protein
MPTVMKSPLIIVCPLYQRNNSMASHRLQKSKPQTTRTRTKQQRSRDETPNPKPQTLNPKQSEGCKLRVYNWSSLWTREHLSTRLLQPLGGTSIEYSIDAAVATLHFGSEKVAGRAGVICRAAAQTATSTISVRERALLWTLALDSRQLVAQKATRRRPR